MVETLARSYAPVVVEEIANKELTVSRDFSPKTFEWLRNNAYSIAKVEGDPLEKRQSSFRLDTLSGQVSDRTDLRDREKDQLVNEIKRSEANFLRKTSVPFQIAFDPQKPFFEHDKGGIPFLPKTREDYLEEIAEENRILGQNGITDAEFFIPEANTIMEFAYKNFEEVGKKIITGFLSKHIITTSEVSEEFFAVVNAQIGTIKSHNQPSISIAHISQTFMAQRCARFIHPKPSA